MLDDVTKRRINTLRQILVGKLPDPKAQVEQITNGLIYKFMNDMDEQSVSMGGKATYFSGKFQKYSWKNLLDTKTSGVEKVALYSEAIEQMYNNENLPELFREIFKNSFLPFKDPSTLNMFLKEINEFNYSHSEKLGDAFEYLLSFMGSQGDAGQFRTPRHIIDFIIEIVNPQKNETTFADRFGRILNASVRGVIAKYPLNSLLSGGDRDRIMNSIQEIVVSNEANYGIKIIDIRIGRTDLTEEVSNNVYQRMRSEREKEANLLRAEGSEISQAIRASADRQKTVILAEAQRTSSILRGEGDAEKNRLLGEAYNVDQDFFNFLRTMQACRDTFGDTNMSMVISPGEVCDKFFGKANINSEN